jgi:lambda family phage tail tape measure protein
MTTVATLDTVMRLNSSAFRAGMISAAGQANQSLGSIQKKAAETASVLLSLKRAANTFGSFYLVKEGIASLIDAQKQLQAIQYTLEAATGSSTAAEQAFGFVRAEADKLGLVLPTAAQGFANLSASATAAGVSMKDQQELFDAYAKSSTTLHLSTEQSGRALLALEQMFAKGKIQAQELRLQLGQAIPGAAQRFQNAVMEMTKGTNLAGKSFDQLLAAGELTTSKFLPALTLALTQSGRGWEDASNGLNANLNRVQTAWFKLKSEVSGGLFNDAATAGAGVLASQLDHIATAVELLGAGALARVAGTKFAAGAEKVVNYTQQYQGARMAAGAEVEYAEAQALAAKQAVAEAAAERAALADQAARLSATRAQTLEERNKAAATIQATTATKAQADADVARLTNSTLPGNARYAAQQAAAAATAQKQLQAATARYNATLAASTALKAEANVQNSALIKSDIALAAAEDALATAQARVAETRAAEAALGGLTATIGRAAKSFGGFALSLVGGPWGAAVAAIGGLAYAVYEVKKASEDYDLETEKQARSLQQLAQQAKDTADAYGTLHSSMNLSGAVEVFAGSAQGISKVRGELADLSAQAEKLRAQISAGEGGANAGAAISNWFDQRKLDGINERISVLSTNLSDAQTSVDGLQSHLSLFVPAVDSLKEAFDRLKNGADLKGIWDGLTAGFDQGIKTIDAAQAKVDSIMSGLTSQGAAWAKKAATEGKSATAQATYDLNQAIENVKAQGLPAAMAAKQIADLRKEAEQPLAQAASADAADAAKKAAAAAVSAAKQQKEAYDSAVRSALDRVAADSATLEGDGKITAAEKERAKVLQDMDSGTLKVTASQRLRLVAILDSDVALQKATLTEQNHQKSLARTAALEDQLAARIQNRVDQNDIDAAGVGHGTEMVQKLQDELRIRQDYQKQVDQLNKEANKPTTEPESRIGGVDYNARLAEIQKALSEETLLYQQGAAAKKAAELDWTNGARAALEDYKTAAENVAGMVQQTWSDAMSGFEDTIVNGLTTGTFHFKQFAADVLKEIARIEIRIAVSKIAGLLLNMFGGTSATGAGDMLNGGSNYTGAGSLSTSWGRAGGGSVRPHTIQQVAENGRPELLHQNGNTYLMTGANAGNVTPITAGRGAGASMAPNVSVAVSVVVNNDGSTKSTADSDTATGKQLGNMMAGVARDAILKEMRPNGVLWKEYGT